MELAEDFIQVSCHSDPAVKGVIKCMEAHENELVRSWVDGESKQLLFRFRPCSETKHPEALMKRIRNMYSQKYVSWILLNKKEAAAHIFNQPL